MTPLPQWLKDWLKESWNRFKMKQPKFFTILSRIASLVILIPGIPYTLRQIENGLLEFAGITYNFPDFLTVLSNKLAIGIGVGLKIGSWLTVKTTPVGQTAEGQAITVLNKEKMPFTTKSEAKDVEETKPPLEVLPEVPEPEEKKEP